MENGTSLVSLCFSLQELTGSALLCLASLTLLLITQGTQLFFILFLSKKMKFDFYSYLICLKDIELACFDLVLATLFISLLKHFSTIKVALSLLLERSPSFFLFPMKHTPGDHAFSWL